MASEIKALIARFAHEEKHKLRHQALAPWLNFRGLGTQCKDFYGRQISYSGLMFSGAPRDVFWGRFIEPFLEDITERGITFACKEAMERHIKQSEPLAEMVGELKSLVRYIFEEMADIDQRLRSAGDHKAMRRNVEDKIKVMESFIDERAAVESNASKAPKPDPWWKSALKALPIIGALFKALWGG